LLALRLADKAKFLRSHHGLTREALLAWSTLGNAAQLIEDLIWRSLMDTAAEVGGAHLHEIRDADAFHSLAEQVGSRLGRTFVARAAELNESLILHGQVARVINGALATRRPEAQLDLSSQLEDLFYPGFLAELDCGRLGHYPRYLRAIEERLAQLEQNPLRDSQRQAEVEPWWRRYLAALQAGHEYDEPLDAFRWLVHEFRVSLFAQRLGTVEKASPKRLAEAWRATGC
jgi:ATP-dependent helicase HrpA